MNDERWLPVVGYEGLYEVSNLGRVRSLDRVVVLRAGVKKPVKGQVLSQHDAWGYQGVSLWRVGKRISEYVHVLVLMAFVGPRPPGMEACHGPNGKEAAPLPGGGAAGTGFVASAAPAGGAGPRAAVTWYEDGSPVGGAAAPAGRLRDCGRVLRRAGFRVEFTAAEAAGGCLLAWRGARSR